jgi:serine/threonine protein kinase
VELEQGDTETMTGRRIAGRIELIESIGQGGMGTVYRAWHHGLQKTIAVKVLSEALDRDPQITARFVREARTAARLEHPSCVRILDFGTDGEDQLLFLAMEFVEGESLAAQLGRVGALPADRACRIIAYVLEVLGAAHDRQIIHRDMKPGNILLTREGGVKVCDFGISKILADDNDDLTDLTKTGAILGTPAYMAPDQFLGLPIDLRTDVYSCGVILYEMLAGRPPFHADSTLRMLMQHAHDEPPSITNFVPDLDPRVVDIVHKAMAKDPTARFASAQEMRRAVLEALDPLMISTRLAADGSPAIVGLADPIDDSVDAARTWPDAPLTLDRSPPPRIEAIPLAAPREATPDAPPRAESSPRARVPVIAPTDTHATAQAGVADLIRGLGWIASEARSGRLAYVYGIVYALTDAPVWSETQAGAYALIRTIAHGLLWLWSARMVRTAAWVQFGTLLALALARPVDTRLHIVEWALTFIVAAYCVVGAYGAASRIEESPDSPRVLAANARVGLISVAAFGLVFLCHRLTREILTPAAPSVATTTLRPAGSSTLNPKDPARDQLADLVREDRLPEAESLTFQRYDSMNGSSDLLPFARTAISRHRSDLRAMAAPATESSLKEGGSDWAKGNCARIAEVALVNQKGWVSGRVLARDDTLPVAVHGVVDYGLSLLAGSEEPDPAYAAFVTVDASGKNGLLWCNFAQGHPSDCCTLSPR